MAARAGEQATRRLDVEFGWHAERVVEAVRSLGLADPVAAACRGSAHPELLARLAGAIGARPGLRVLDAGCGLGGPMMWLERSRGCRVVGVDLMEAAARGARRLFPGAGVVRADLGALPLRDASFGAAWMVGALSTMPDVGGALAELGRVLAPGARLAVHDYVACCPEPFEAPVANAFVSAEALTDLIGSSGLRLLASAPAPALGPAPVSWREQLEAVEGVIASRYGHDPRYRAEAGERASFRRLVAASRIACWLTVAERPV